MSKTVLVAIADGVEEIELSCVVDVLRRAGLATTVASIDPRGLPATGSRGLVIQSDCLIDHCLEQEWDLIVLPGGSGAAERFGQHEALVERLRRQREGGGLFAAICASPALALAPHGLLDGFRATCYPGYAERLGKSWTDQPVIVDRNCITSQAPGTAMAFALQLAGLLAGESKADELAQQMLVTQH